MPGGGGCVFGEKMINCVWFSSVEDSKREEKPIVKSGGRKSCLGVGDMCVGECYTCMCGGWGIERWGLCVICFRRDEKLMRMEKKSREEVKVQDEVLIIWSVAYMSQSPGNGGGIMYPKLADWLPVNTNQPLILKLGDGYVSR